MQAIIGFDVGTSSVKAAVVTPDGGVWTCRETYGADAPQGGTPALWWEAVCRAARRAARQFSGARIEGVGLTAQVGTYLLYRDGLPPERLPVYGWTEPGGERELAALTAEHGPDFYTAHIGMPQPRLTSYPLPRLSFLAHKFPEEWAACTAVLAPKDYLYLRLTGAPHTDVFTWNGLARKAGCAPDGEALSLCGLTADRLPPVGMPTQAPGRLTADAAGELGLPAGIPVYLGCNDCHASLLGMGVCRAGQAFDLTGTSEHVGMIADGVAGDDSMVCAPFFDGYAAFGVTASSGRSIDWGFETFGGPDGGEESILRGVLDGTEKPPVFLPYLCGERAPVWDERARGVFFGLEGRHTRAHLRYAVLEGVAFSAFAIWRTLPGALSHTARALRVGGGAADNALLLRLKAALFGIPLELPAEKNCGALGAAMVAGVGAGWFNGFSEAADRYVQVTRRGVPQDDPAPLLSRFAVYEKLYPALKNLFGTL